MAERKPMTKMNAPKGAAKFPKLLEPDMGTAKFPKPDGEYTTRIVWEGNDPAFQKFKAKIDALMEKRIAAAEVAFEALPKKTRDKLGKITINHPITEVYDKEDNPTGQYEAKFSAKAGGVVKNGDRKGKPWSRKIDLFDAFGRKLDAKKVPAIWGGSVLIVAFNFDPEGYFIDGTAATGLSFQLDAVQIVTLRAGGERGAADYGFGSEEGGFSADDLAEQEEGDGGDPDGLDGDDDTPAPEPKGATDF
jgi:hypothetical protein